MSNDNRRRSFRLKDTMRMHARVINDVEYAEALHDFDDFRARYCLKSHLLVQKEAHRSDMQIIKKREPEIAGYLEFLEKQLLMLASLRTDDQSEFEPLNSTPVNISSHGLCYSASEALPIGTNIELRLHLSTSGHEIALLADVVRAETDTAVDNPLPVLISLTYKHVHPDDREAIIRHMARLQQLQLQAKRDETED